MTGRNIIPMGEAEFVGWLGRAKPGDTLIYYRGFLAVDRKSLPDGGALNRLADRAAWAFTQGLADLLQRRHGPDDSSYLAVARRAAKNLSQNP